MATPIYSLIDGTVAGDPIPHGDLNKISDTIERVAVDFAALRASDGIRRASDLNGTAVGGALSVQVSSGDALLGDTQTTRGWVKNPAPVTVAGLPASQATIYVWFKPDGTFYADTVLVNKPANSHLCMIVTTDGTHATAIDNAPPGRVDLDTTVPDVTFTIGAIVGTTRQLTVQVRDAGKVSLAQRESLVMWLADSAYAAETANAPSGGWAAGVGYKLADEVANKRARFGTDASGVSRVDITQAAGSSRSWVLHCVLGDRVYTSGIISFP